MDDFFDTISGAAGVPKQAPARSSQYDGLFAAAGEKYGIDPDMLKGIARTESSFNPNAVSHDDNGRPIAHGLMQFTPATAKGVGVADPYDPAQSIDGAGKLMRANLDASGGDATKALMMYHGGPNTAIWGPKTKAYPGKVLGQSAQVSQAPPSDGFDGFDASTIEKAVNDHAATVAQLDAPKASGTSPADIPDNLPQITVTGKREPAQEPSLWDKAVGVGDAGLGLAANVAGMIPGTIAAAGSVLTNGKFGTQEGVNEAGKRFMDVSQGAADSLWTPHTDIGKKYLGNVGEALNDSGLAGLAPIAEMSALARLKAPAAASEVGNATSQMNAAFKAKQTAPAIADRIEPTLGKPRIKLNIDGTQTPIAGAVPEVAPAVEAITPAAEFSAAHAIDTAKSGSKLSLPEQQARAEILKRVGLDEAHDGAITGDALKAGVVAKTAQFTTEPAGIAASDLLSKERAALEQHAQGIIDNTGGLQGMDQKSLVAKGQNITAPLDGLGQWYEDKYKGLYKASDERASGQPTTALDEFGGLMNTESKFAGKAANGSLGNGIKAYLREQKIMDTDGNMRPISVKEAEGIKQYINGEYTHETSGLSGAIKDAIDSDVTRSAGEDIYKEARAVFREKKQTIDNPNGISKLLSFDPRTPTNRATPFQDVADKVTGLEPGQFKHITDTLKGMTKNADLPLELRTQANDAINTIKSHMAESVLQQGSKNAKTWNAKAATAELSANTARMPEVFNAEELAKLKDLNDAGHILHADGSYPGAAAQSQLGMKKGLMPHVIGGLGAPAGALAGSILGAPGAAVGSYFGRAAGAAATARMGEAAALKNFKKGVMKLSDVAP